MAKKIIRLTETQLRKLIEKVIKEQGDVVGLEAQPGYDAKDLSTKQKVNVQILVNDRAWDFTEVRKQPWGCEFFGNPRNQQPTLKGGEITQGFYFYIDGKFVSMYDTKTPLKVSPDAVNRLKTACGTDQYVKTKTSQPQNIA